MTYYVAMKYQNLFPEINILIAKEIVLRTIHNFWSIRDRQIDFVRYFHKLLEKCGVLNWRYKIFIVARKICPFKYYCRFIYYLKIKKKNKVKIFGLHKTLFFSPFVSQIKIFTKRNEFLTATISGNKH